jgi:outer membrane protein OmpA-like peptidoglycan-associated protein
MKKICLAFAALVLTGCQTPQTVAPPPPAPPTAPPQPHRIAPLPPVQSAGPLGRADVATYMNAQEADLRSYLRGQSVLVARRGDTLVVTVPSDRVLDKSGIGDWGNAFLQSVAQVIAHFDRTLVEVNCYTDSSAGEQQSLALSQTRAKTIADGLAGYGIAAARLKAAGLGAANPRVADTRDASNRRIEIKIVPDPK